MEKAGKKSEQLVAGHGRDTDRGVRKERKRREVGPLATPTHYTISILLVKVNLSIAVSMRWRSGGSATLMPVRNPGPRDVQTSASRDSTAREEAEPNWDSAGPRIASAFFASSLPLRS